MKALDIKRVIKECIKRPTESVPVFLWGGPGVGKSSVVKQAAQEEGVNCIDIRLVLLDPTDLRGLPVPENGKVKWLPPSFLPTEDSGVIFIDELNCLVEGTPVLVVTPKGKYLKAKPIEQVRRGDKVFSWDLTKWAGCVNVVEQTFINSTSQVVQLEFTNGMTLEMTKEHPVYVKDKSWKRAEDIKPGDRVCYLSNLWQSLQDINKHPSTQSAWASHKRIPETISQLSPGSVSGEGVSNSQRGGDEEGKGDLSALWAETGGVLAEPFPRTESRLSAERASNITHSLYKGRAGRMGTEGQSDCSAEISRPFIKSRQSSSSEGILAESRRESPSLRKSQEYVGGCKEGSRDRSQNIKKDERGTNTPSQGFIDAYSFREDAYVSNGGVSTPFGVLRGWQIPPTGTEQKVANTRFYSKRPEESYSGGQLFASGLGDGEQGLSSSRLSGPENQCSRVAGQELGYQEDNRILEWLEVSAVSVLSYQVRVYNLHTKPNNNYFAKGILCHNCAPPLVQNSALQLVLDRKLGEYVVPDGYCLVAAGNREMEAFVHRMSPPLLNRFLHVDFDVDNEVWSHWAVQNDVAPQIIGLLTKFRPELIYKFEPQKKAYPTPRSWTFASKILKNGLPEELKFELIKGCVGEGAAIELRAYMEIWSQLPNLDAILAGKDDTIPKGIDLIYATAIGLVSKATKPAHYNRLLEYALMLEREYSVFLVKLLYQKSKELVAKAPAWSQFAKVLVVEDKILS